ncbi:hypothetical protein Pla22_50490 [Rubripirellula amarantea]|uniref:Hydrogenase maturation protease n=1 Tax=Rubripirellula amarantea TaxID=2527999 RepID=A0A5C5WDC5_9BACT|nr:hydrogenase maturation protease [Rubripirellula amarantea]TWT48049.1 hypothetical protein Pla22_50490 [Rubripirellula amarantea]
MTKPKTLVVGIGSPHGDDAIGWLVADALKESTDGGETRIEKAASPIEIFNAIDDCERLILCDGCSGLGSPGDTRRWQWPSSEFGQVNWSGTHDFSLIATLQLGERLNRLPPQVVVWAIEIDTNRVGDTLSPSVASAIPDFVQQIKQEMAKDCIEPHHA